MPELPEQKDRLVDYLGNKDRYYSLNIASLHKHGTLEVRLHSGTTDAKKIIRWMSLMRSIYEYATGSWGDKQSTIKSLFDMPIDEAKANKVWEVLGISDEDKAHFNGRVQRFIIPTLLKQQESAKKVMELEAPWKRAQKKLSEMRQEYETISSQRNHLLSAFQNVA
jgi:hypothetical protein